ncbi:hypothetical protein Z517_05006 [Fonsecaea pedrosoi CBS 271.37]|uniref:Uncharacterized protein n=1 Tax=Fonsecaea pedrosoi CBS 271.37 TaxID=1442368 RepID=A0A0D2GTW5_9EURO|nr:uncharacterized protein Z517_05006 [Fonsecaea pedrosoi CBS 271.37]KIW81980.1 hypothetical protein Z517_05006 [Fonsecaea pedrosoi CBS 271.37]
MPSTAVKDKLFHFVLTAVTTAFFIMTALFGSYSTSATSISLVVKRFSSAIAVLRILQSLTSASTSFLLNYTLEVIQWTLCSRRDGLRLLSFLSISPTTGFPVKTKVATVYDPYYTFSATAGVGLFNGSLARQMIGTFHGTITYQVLAYSYNFVTNTQFSVRSPPVACSGHCDSYIFPGALWSLQPPFPRNAPLDAVVNIGVSPAIQLDFMRGLGIGDTFSPQDCTVYHENGVRYGLMVCLAKSKLHPESTIAGLFLCSEVREGSCITSRVPFSLTTTLTVYGLSTSTACSRGNNSILSIADVGKPAVHEVDVGALGSALDWLLNSTAQGLPPASSLIFLFSNAAPGANYDEWSIITYPSLESILAFPIWQFSIKGGGSTAESLPPEFHTSASLSNPLDKIVLNQAAFLVYLVLQTTVVAFLWVVLLWRCLWKSSTPQLSAYPLIDFSAKLDTQYKIGEFRPTCDLKKEVATDAESKEVIDALVGVMVLDRALGEEKLLRNRILMM